MRRLASVVLFGALLLSVAAPASAHEGREVAGKYHFTVGWGDEPTYAGFKNSVELVLTDHDDKPVTDLTDTLKVEITSGEQSVTMTMEPNFRVGAFGEPGDYRAFIVPTRPGDYTFKFTGTIRGDTINETFTSGDTTFSPVASQDAIQFPAKDPTTGDLAQKLDRETARLASEAGTAADDASGARTFGIIGIVVGAIGVIVGVAALRRNS